MFDILAFSNNSYAIAHHLTWHFMNFSEHLWAHAEPTDQ